KGGDYPLYIATDSEKIFQEAKSFGAPVLMTSSKHKSGTERVAEVAEKMDSFDWVINLQGDEPEMPPHYIQILASSIQKNPSWESATLAAPFESAEEVNDPSKVKVVLDKQNRALYFSRSPIPYPRRRYSSYLRHIGIYAFRREFLLKLVRFPRGPLEEAEQLEQLRVLENGFTMGVRLVASVPPGIDTEEDFRAFEKRMEAKNKG
ncbi:MAG: 3-deoxy-manno-octulosonate cytidylyltransferase, partial [Planctomycetota bacterium]